MLLLSYKNNRKSMQVFMLVRSSSYAPLALPSPSVFPPLHFSLPLPVTQCQPTKLLAIKTHTVAADTDNNCLSFQKGDLLFLISRSVTPLTDSLSLGMSITVSIIIGMMEPVNNAYHIIGGIVSFIERFSSLLRLRMCRFRTSVSFIERFSECPLSEVERFSSLLRLRMCRFRTSVSFIERFSSLLRLDLGPLCPL